MPVKTQETSTTDAKRVSYAELSIIYDRIYDIADRLFRKYNPCNIHIKDNKTKCTNKHYLYNYLCCSSWGSDCKYWQKGCTIKCLACKLFICSIIRDNKKNANLVKHIKRLRRIINRYGLSNFDYFKTKKTVIQNYRRVWL